MYGFSVLVKEKEFWQIHSASYSRPLERIIWNGRWGCADVDKRRGYVETAKETGTLRLTWRGRVVCVLVLTDPSVTVLPAVKIDVRRIPAIGLCVDSMTLELLYTSKIPIS